MSDDRTWILPAGLDRRLRAFAERAGPREACGLLVGTQERGRSRVRAVVNVRNLRTEPDRFELHPADRVVVEGWARGLGWSLLAVWHSHPRGPARPSLLDRAGAEPGLALAITGRSPSGGDFETRIHPQELAGGLGGSSGSAPRGGSQPRAVGRPNP